MQACDRCYRRKCKCDKAVPTCGQCQKARTACLYVNRSQEPTVRREAVERIERRLRQAEARNRALSSQLATYQSLPHNSIHQERRENPPPSVLSPNFPFDRNEVADEVSFLSRHAGGERSYSNIASDILFAHLVQGVASLNSSSRHEHSTNRASPRPVTPTTRSLRISSESLPPEKVARQLHQAYFNHHHLCYPFLNHLSVMANLDRIYTDGIVLEADAVVAFQFYMVLAIAMTSAHKCDWQSLPESEKFQAQAMTRVNEVLQRADIHALQALLLLCQYRMTSSTQETSASLWHMVGFAARMCSEQGLHRNETYYKPSGLPDNEDLLAASETRRRCFWCVVNMDRIVSITLGRPLAIHLEDVDTALPEPIIESSDSNLWNKDLPFPTAIFNHITRYRILSGKVMTSLHSNRADARDEASAATARVALIEELEQWRNESENLRLHPESRENTRRSCFLSPEWYELLYYNALLMLNRPSPVLPSISARSLATLQSIFDASREAIARYALLHTSQRINYTWITLHAVFMAGLSYIYAVGRHYRARQVNTRAPLERSTLSTDPAIIEVVNTCRSCSIVLVAVSERWATPRYCHQVFDRLSDAVLADVIAYFTQLTTSSTSINDSGMPRNSMLAPQPDLNAPLSSGSGATLPPMTTATSVPLGVDTVLRDCFEDLQHFHDTYSGDGPIRQLSQDWLQEIGGMTFHAVQSWGNND
ncbi:Zn(II)2Cys6 transcription factor [Aspergillus udagawae]|uniref:Zn(2)-C6 fungal-type domain-containing protein n=1 Tax=Aspergillus udagawae TaxID=91492 RepID=A0A8E0QWA3_9EURO|nr:uncharacterized protein Aud_008875 [Aspergillus udagawae]GIC92409.1 hypothetical protein Aud_008875 [Aspergillus udagawae]